MWKHKYIYRNITFQVKWRVFRKEGLGFIFWLDCCQTSFSLNLSLNTLVSLVSLPALCNIKSNLSNHHNNYNHQFSLHIGLQVPIASFSSIVTMQLNVHTQYVRFLAPYLLNRNVGGGAVGLVSNFGNDRSAAGFAKEGKYRCCWSCWDYFELFFNRAFGFNIVVHIARPQHTLEPCRRTWVPNPGPSTRMIMSYRRWLVCNVKPRLLASFDRFGSLRVPTVFYEWVNVDRKQVIIYAQCNFANSEHLLSCELCKSVHVLSFGIPREAVFRLKSNGTFPVKEKTPSLLANQSYFTCAPQRYRQPRLCLFAGKGPLAQNSSSFTRVGQYLQIRMCVLISLCENVAY